MAESPAYGLWPLVLVNSAVFIFFAMSFAPPRTRRDWGSLGAFSAFVAALFAEMYGYPLTIYVLSGWLQSRYPGTDFLAHDAGHLLETLFGWKANPHLGPFHVASNVLIAGGFLLLYGAWRRLYQAQSTGLLAVDGPYARIRHPQYAAFVMILAGFLVQWPTILTLAMFPVLVVMYVRLARREDRESEERFGEAWRRYAAATPAFWPRLGAGAMR